MTWRTHRIREMANLVNGYPFDSADFSAAGEVPLVRIRDILAEEFETFVPKAKVPSAAIVRNDDVVIGMDTTGREPIAKFVIMRRKRIGHAERRRRFAARPHIIEHPL